jgi:signal transduction histidine kinase
MSFGRQQSLTMDALPCAAAYVDTTGVILAANDQFERLWPAGTGAGRCAPGTVLTTMFAEDQREAIREMLAAEAAAGPRTHTTKLMGSMEPIQAELAPVPENGTSRGAWLVMLRPIASEGHDRERIQDALAAGLFHDLRAPLQVVLGWAAMLKHHHDDASRLEHALTVIERNTRLELSLLDDLLELSRPAWARPSIRSTPVHLAELVITVVRGLEVAAEERGVRLLLAIDSPTMIVAGDHNHFQRVVVNLVTNALKFTPKGGTVECHLSWKDDWAQLAVSDSGCGIRGDFLPHVFDPFVQEQASAPNSAAGVGLGLSVVKHLVELHGGKVTVESPGSGQGATFTVLLPAVPYLAVARPAMAASTALRWSNCEGCGL